jgi:uncharacterized protein
MNGEKSYSAFADAAHLVTGTLEEMLRKTKEYLDQQNPGQLLIFDNDTGEQVDYDFTGTVSQVLERATGREPKRGPGRPKLGVVSREVSLLPRHWEWLDRQPQSASATIRRLVEAARKNGLGDADPRLRIEAAGRFMWAIAGNCENFEEASRALYAHNWDGLRQLTDGWPQDIREHLFWMLKSVVVPATL